MGSSHGTTGVWLHIVGYHMWRVVVGYCVEWVHHMALQACGFILLVIVLNGFITCHYRRVASCCWLLC